MLRAPVEGGACAAGGTGSLPGAKSAGSSRQGVLQRGSHDGGAGRRENVSASQEDGRTNERTRESADTTMMDDRTAYDAG